MRASTAPLYRRAFRDHDAAMIVPLVPAAWVFLGAALCLDGRFFAAAAQTAGVALGAAPEGASPLDPGAAMIVGAVLAAVYPGGALLWLWYVVDGIPTRASIEDGHLVRTRGGLLRRTDAIPLRDVERAWAFEDTRTRGRPFRIELDLRGGRRVRWLTVGRARQRRLDPIVAALREQVDVVNEVPPRRR
jgi:hypothetical protein